MVKRLKAFHRELLEETLLAVSKSQGPEGQRTRTKAEAKVTQQLSNHQGFAQRLMTKFLIRDESE